MQSLRFIAASKNACLIAQARRSLQPPTRRHLERRCWMSDESATSTNTSDRIHSTDIAFKPAESGWGATKKYESNYDRIFGSKKNIEETSTTSTTTIRPTTTTTTTTATPVSPTAKPNQS